MRRTLIPLLIAVFLTGCATNSSNTIPKQPRITSPATLSQLAQGKRLFQDGYYKQAMEQLLPLATEGNMEAQYAVGYMYYYGFGAIQDTSSGMLWVQRAADQGFEPAAKALPMMKQKQRKS